MRFSFIHAADLHLDTPFEGITRVSPRLAELLRDASLEAFDRIVALALEREVAFVLFAGDIYDGEDRGVRAQLRFLRGVERLSRAGISVLLCHGNHDPLGGWSAIRHWPENVKVFGSRQVEAFPVEWQGHKVATVYGLSYDRREVRENLVERFLPLPGVASGDDARRGLEIAMLHCTVGHQPEHAPYSPCSLEDLQKVRVHYWALGHIHRHAVLSCAGQWAVYPGNTQGRSPKPSETGTKGVVVVTCEDEHILAVEHVPTDVVRFATLPVNLQELPETSDLGDLRKVLVRQAASLVDENAGRALILRIYLGGRSDLYHVLRRPGAIEQLLQDLREESAYEESGLVWWESAINDTRPPTDLSSLEGRTDFLGAFVEHWKNVRADPDQLTAIKEQLFSSVPAQFVRRLDEVEQQRLVELLDKAAYEALDALEASEQ